MADTMIDAIKRRVSVRTFSAEPVPPEVMDAFRGGMLRNGADLFGNRPRFLVIDPREERLGETAGLFTYGVVKNSGFFIAGAVPRGPGALTDFGYAMERHILEAVSLGLGTCWLGGTFSRSAFSRAMGLRDGELLPAVSPLGIPAAEKSLVDGVLSFAARSRLRRPWKEIFHRGRPGVPLSPGEAGAYAEVLECVRMAPSALNRQPWRVVREESADVFHFYIVSEGGGGEIRLPEIDIGIALCHFELAAGALGLSGSWSGKTGSGGVEGWTHILTWEGR